MVILLLNMKLLVTKPVLFLAFCYSFFLISCSKPSSSDCPTPSKILITTNSPVIEGWPLRLEANYQSITHLYKWSGPNGWKMDYAIYSSDAYLQGRENMIMADKGEYKLQMVTDQGCIEYEGTVTVDVIPAPDPTCNIAANTSTSSVAGVGDFNFLIRNFSASSGFFDITGRETVPGDIMHFSFLGNVAPLPGIYKTSGYFATGADKVGLYINSFTVDFVSDPDQTVFVKKVSNKLEITFCGLKFGNPTRPSNPITISAKIVQP